MKYCLSQALLFVMKKSIGGSTCTEPISTFQSQSSAHSDITGTTFGEIAKPVSPPQDLLADFGEPASPTADSFADFNPRQSSSSASEFLGFTNFET